jgi:phosphoglycolate phosphatase
MGTAGHIIIFDLDGTLIDSRRDLATGVNLTRRELGLEPLPVEVVASHVGDGMRKLVERSLADMGDGPDLDRIVARMRANYLAHLTDETTVYPGVPDALELIRAKGYAAAVVTNKPLEPSRALCDHLGLSPLLDTVIGAGEGLSLKPHPEPLIEALRRTGSERAGSWIAGDHHTDLAAGRRAGLSRCFCRYGFGRADDESWEMAVDSLTELAEALPER